MILYHVSYKPIKNFILRVPKHRLADEDNTTPRICCSTTIENCIMAKPGQTEFLYLCMEHNLPCILYVYEFNVKSDDPNVIVPTQLQESNAVPDAEILQEYWLCNKIPEFKEYVFKVNDVFRSGDWLNRVELTNEISKFDFLFVNLALDYERKTGQPLNPNEVFPQIWDEIMQNLHKYRV